MIVLTEGPKGAGHLTYARSLRKLNRPFRAPHHTVSRTGLIGELAIAAGGVLYLGAMSDWDREDIRALGQYHAAMDQAGGAPTIVGSVAPMCGSSVWPALRALPIHNGRPVRVGTVMRDIMCMLLRLGIGSRACDVAEFYSLPLSRVVRVMSSLRRIGWIA